MAPVTTSAFNSLRDGDSNNNNNGKRLVQKYLTNCKSLYSCIYCRTHLANHDELVSRSFTGNHGRAYLFNSVINISCGPAVQRELITGSHAVADIYCSNCEKTLGWKYEKAYVETQKYKEGKYIIELAHVVRENRHLELDKGEIIFARNKRNRSSSASSSSSSFNQTNKKSSLMPQSLNQWSSSATSTTATSFSSNEEVVEDDEELMFPFYDDLCCGRSSYPSNLSSSHHNRVRRSLYLDSTPYDWKHASASSSANPSSSQNQSAEVTSSGNVASSLDSAYSSQSPSSSSDQSPSSSSLEQKLPFHIKGNNNNNFEGSNKSPPCEGEKEEDETQFKFEADKPEHSNDKLASCTELQQDGKQTCDCLASDDLNDAQRSSQSSDSINNDFGVPSSPSSSEPNSGDNDDDGGGDYLNHLSKSSLGSFISLDDEKFYDCMTDHDVSRLVVSTDSSGNL